MTKRARKPVRSLFRRPKPKTLIVETLTPEELLEAFRPLLAGPKHALDVALAKISRTAELASTSTDIPDAAGHAERIRSRLEDVRREVVDDTVSREQLAYAALKLAEAWMELRMDAIAARDVRAAEAKVPKKLRSDDQIRERVARGGTRQEQADDLLMSTRQLTTRLKQINRK